VIHSAAYVDLRYDLFRVCAFVAANALLCNFLPPSVKLKKYPKTRYCYEVLIDLMAGFALNWRTQIPSLDGEFIGFKRVAVHTYRNWLQSKADAKERG
jgi:hypothetical protein